MKRKAQQRKFLLSLNIHCQEQDIYRNMKVNIGAFEEVSEGNQEHDIGN